MSHLKERSIWSLIGNTLGLTSWERLCGGRNRVKAPPRTRPQQRALAKVETLEDRLVPASLVLGTDGNLWLEDPGWQTNGRILIDGNVRGFAQGSDGYDYVLGSDGNLWKEYPYWQLTNGRVWIDGNVRSFALGGDGYDYVLGSDGNLWKELPGWPTNGRTWVDGSVQSFARGSDGYDYVLGSDGNLWQELPGWQTNGRTWVDGCVRGFVNGNDSYFVTLGPRPAASTAYSPVTGTLFGSSGPSYLDVRQGAAADCWLMASLAEVAARAPADITSMFTYDGTTVDNGSAVDVYTVRFYDSQGVAQYVTVDTELPSGGGTYDHPVNGVLWVALAEKAYVEANAIGLVTTQHVGTNSYTAVDYGDPTWALQAITGKPANDYNINTSDIVTAWNAGKLVVLCTGSPADSRIVGNHCYAMVNYDPSNSLPFEIFNAWGTDSDGWAPGHSGTIFGLFIANAPFVSENFSYQSIGAGAAPQNHAVYGMLIADKAFPSESFGYQSFEAGAAPRSQSLDSFGGATAPGGQQGYHPRSSQELTDLVFSEELLDAHSKTRSGSDAVLFPDFARL